MYLSPVERSCCCINSFFPSMGERFSSTNPTPVLTKLAQRLRQSHSGIYLNDKVERDETIAPLKGGYAFVYRGTMSSRRVAIKIVHSVPLGDEKSIRCVLREVYVWSKLRHPNIVPLLGITTKFNHGVAIVSEWMQNGNAFDYVQDRNIDPRPLLEDIANALRYLHEHVRGPVIHGDLKGVGFSHAVSDALETNRYK
ncbi:hypothetical protein ID866_9572 [Astraeus odoratus]|nr:hypothetical protein ID866_9572 [Astraeus odoratus]